MEKIKSLLDEFEVLVNLAISSEIEHKDIVKLKASVNDFAREIVKKDLKIDDFITLIKPDYSVASHSVNVSIYAALLAKYIKLDIKEIRVVITASLLHDIGKGSVNERILQKNGKLSEAEFNEMKKHTIFGYRQAKGFGIDDRDVLVAIHHHHERMDGSGYPSGIKADLITKYSRIVGLCDIYDAMTSKRIFQEQSAAFDVLLEVKKEMQTKVDQTLLQSLIKMLSEKKI